MSEVQVGDSVILYTDVSGLQAESHIFVYLDVCLRDKAKEM